MVSNEHSLNLERRQFTWIYSMHFILKKWLSLDTRWSRQHFSTGILIGDIEELYGHMHISTKKFISVKKKAFKNAERNLLKKHLKMLIGLNKRQMSKYRYAKRQFTEKYLHSVLTLQFSMHKELWVSMYIYRNDTGINASKVTTI